MKLKQRKALGWDEVHEAIDEAPFCYLNEQIVNVLFCYCGRCSCPRNNLCNLCHRNGGNHYLVYPIHDEDDYNDCFKKIYVGWSGELRNCFNEVKKGSIRFFKKTDFMKFFLIQIIKVFGKSYSLHF